MRILVTFILFFTGFIGFSQSTDLPLNSDYYPILEEWDIKSDTSLFTAVKPVSRYQLAEWSKGIRADQLNKADLFDYRQLILESREHQDSFPDPSSAFLKYLFHYHNDFFSIQREHLDLHLNPVIQWMIGSDNRAEQLVYINTRGVELRGIIDQKIAFYSMLTENQARYPAYITNIIDSTLAVPFEGFWKRLSDGAGVDFLRARGYIDFGISRHISAQFGYGKHFIGNGNRSLILSDYGNNYPYLRLNTKVWRIQYTNIFAQFIGDIRGNRDGLFGVGSFTKKYLALHRLSVNLGKKLNLGLFESVVFGQPDSISPNNYKLEYLNPIIFYRALEQQDGSADNVLIGLDFKWNFLKRFSFYGQLVIDELQIRELINNTGWWGSKQAFQLGLKYVDAFSLKNLDLQVEYNLVRPYTYSHENNYTSYSHYGLPLAHPIGANFTEKLFNIRYRILDRLSISMTGILSQYGTDTDSISYGKNVLRSYASASRPASGDFGHRIGQGNATDLLLFQSALNYQLMPNMTIELQSTIRKEIDELRTLDSQSAIFALGFRWNFPSRNYWF